MDTRTTEQKREDFLTKLKADCPDMKVHFINQQTKEIWISEKVLSELSPQELTQVNLRKSRPDEIVFDVEDRILIPEIRKKLELRQFDFTQWNTGSRGTHFHILFSNLAELPLDLRNRIRKYLIREIGTDEALAKESQFVALEYTPHFKTGVEKYLFDSFSDPCNSNLIEAKIIDYCKKELELEKTEVINLVSNKAPDEDFKDYYKTDPYLLYTLQNKIESGERNNVLFKNLAIGLVKSGLSKPDIEKFAVRIAQSCPGKTKNEFMGWVDKALFGEVKDYNKSELLIWAAKYNHPILYDLIGTEDLDKLMSIKMLFDIVWNHRIAKQPVWKDLCFYNMLGTVIDETVEDYRVHVIFSSFSGTGKDEGLNLVKEILDKLDIRTDKPASITDRTLLGAINPTAIEMNTKYGLDEATPESGKHKYRDPVEKGLLAKTKWLAFGESESVFKPSAFNRQIQLILRQAMDKARFVEKGVGGYMIKLNTNTTFAFVTYNMNDTIYKLLNNGLFQRALYYNKEITDEEHKAIVEHISNRRFNSSINENFDERKYLTLLVEKLKHLQTWYQENKSFKLFSDSEKYVKHLWAEYAKQYDILVYADKQIMDSIIRRAGNNLYKLAVLNAAADKRNVINKEDITKAYELVTICTDSIRLMIVGQNKIKKIIIGALMILKSGEKTIMNIHQELDDKLGLKSSATRNSIVKRIIDLGYARRREDGKYSFLTLTDLGLEELGEM